MIVRIVVCLANSVANSDRCPFWQTIRSFLLITFYVLELFPSYICIYIYICSVYALVFYLLCFSSCIAAIVRVCLGLASLNALFCNTRNTVGFLKGSWDLVIRVISKVTIVMSCLIITPIQVRITLLAKSHDPPGGGGCHGCILGKLYPKPQTLKPKTLNPKPVNPKP